MNILPAQMIREADAVTMRTEPIADIDLMERAARACFNWIRERHPSGVPFAVFCGPGNNGGDGLAVARMLIAAGYRVATRVLSAPDGMSPSCRVNYDRLLAAAGNDGYLIPQQVTDAGSLACPDPGCVILDAIFGNGLTRPPEGLPAEVIRFINGSGLPVIAIDLPSGLYCDTSTNATGGPVVRAGHTLTFAPPKLALFFAENAPCTGTWHLLPIGLDEVFIGSAPVQNHMLTAGELRPLLRERGKFSHKGHFGHTLLLAGSTGKMGAAILASRACLRAGTGLLSARVPAGGNSILQTAVPEAMTLPDESDGCLSGIPDLGPYTAIAAGPGMGTSALAAAALKVLIQEAAVPVVFDADAINILAENKTWLGFLPQGSVFTPHPKEFERLAGKSGDDFERNQRQRDFSVRNQCHVILKGAHTAITTPGGHCYFNTTGNPGMATGGSGDVLTGMLAGLLAQGYPVTEACLLGVYLHGLAGDLALATESRESLVAGDIIQHIGKAFQQLYGKF